MPNPAVVWILEWIEGFQNDPAILSHLLEWSLRLEKPSIPAELRGAVVEAAYELKVGGSSESDARDKAERIVSRLKTVLTRVD